MSPASVELTRNCSSLESVDVDAVREAIEMDGYQIIQGLVSMDDVTAIREFWLTAFRERSTAAPVIWGPHLGEQNRILFHRSSTSCLYRSYDFLWNTPIHALTRELGLKLSRMRNRIAETDLSSGETYAGDGYGIYITTSYYPPRQGWMADHEDQTDGRRHWHFILPLTFKGIDYADGGLALTDRSGRRVNIDSNMNPSSVIFYDGSLPHCVETIRCGDGQSVGRLQVFSIPTFIQRPQDSDRLVEDISMLDIVKGKLRPIKHRLQGVRGAAPKWSEFH